jgi:hypothetical protein
VLVTAWLLDRLLTRPCVLYLRTEGPPDGDGAPALTVETIATTCYAEQANAAEAAGQPAWPTEDWRVVVSTPDGMDLTGLDRLDVGPIPMEVTGGPWPVRDPHDDVVHHVELRARRAEGNTDSPPLPPPWAVPLMHNEHDGAWSGEVGQGIVSGGSHDNLFDFVTTDGVWDETLANMAVPADAPAGTAHVTIAVNVPGVAVRDYLIADLADGFANAWGGETLDVIIASGVRSLVDTWTGYDADDAVLWSLTATYTYVVLP